MNLTTDEFLAIFGKSSEDARWVNSADSAEFLERVIYFADRNAKESRP